MVKTFLRYRLNSFLPYISAMSTLALSISLLVWLGNLANKVALNRAELTQTAYDLARLDKIITDRKKYALELSLIAQTMPHGYHEVALAIATIEAEARSQSVTLDIRIDDEANEETNRFHSLTMTFFLSGSYVNIQNFLSRLNSMAYHTRIESLALDTQSGSLTGLISMKLYID